MSTDGLRPTDFDRVAAAWLANGPAELADRVLDDALREVHRTPQRHRLAAPWRTFTVNRYLAAAAAALVLVVAGFALFGRGGPQTASSPTPGPAATVMATPAPSAVATPGTTVVDQSSSAGYTIGVPSQWRHSASPDGHVVFVPTLPIRSGEIWVGQRPAGTSGPYVIDEGSGANGTVTLSGRTVAELVASNDSWYVRYADGKGQNGHPVSIDGEAAWAAEYSGDGIAYIEVIVIHGDRAYDIQLGAPPANLAELRSTMDQLLASMRWTS